MITNIFLVAFALTSCFGKEENKTKSSGKNDTRNPLGIPVTATERNDLNNDVNNLSKTIDKAEKLIEEGDVEGFRELVENNKKLKEQEYTAWINKKYSSSENNILHVIASKSKGSTEMRDMLEILMEEDLYSFIKLINSKNSEDKLPSDLAKDFRERIVVTQIEKKAIKNDDRVLEALKDAVMEDDVDFLQLLYNKLGERNNSIRRDRIFKEEWKWDVDDEVLMYFEAPNTKQSLVQDLASLAKLNNKGYSLAFLDKKGLIDDTKVYAKRKFSNGTNPLIYLRNIEEVR